MKGVTFCILCFLSLTHSYAEAFMSPASFRSHPSSLMAAKQSIAVVGTGAVGGYYGARLWECGCYDVRFHMRGDNFRRSTELGLNVTSVHGDIFIPNHSLQAFAETKDIGPVDWVVVCLKSSSLDAIPVLISPLLKRTTRVLVIMNGLVEEDLVQMVKVHMVDTTNGVDRIECCAAVYGGMALICSNRLGPGRIDHSYAGLLSGGVAACSTTTSKDENRQAFEDLWGPTKVEIAYESSLLRGRWKKNLWNLPFNGISVAMGGITVDMIVTDPGLRELSDIVMDETVAVANADLAHHGEDPSLYLGDTEKQIMMDLSDNMGPYRTSTMIDLIERKSMEVRYLFRKPLERANSLSVPVPHLQTLVTQIEAFQRFYNLY